MGGNAIKNIRRVNVEEYIKLEEQVIKKLSKYFNRIERIPYFSEKETFGDMDLLVQEPRCSFEKMKEIVKEEFNSREFFNQYKEKELNDVFSFEYKDFQIDLIFTKEENMEIAKFFFSYNDLGNLIGRIANQFNLKFGFDGLNYVMRYNDGITSKKRILLTKDPREIYNFLDYDYNRYLKGFNNPLEIFEFVTTSKYFSVECFKYENLNHQNRTRNKKRANYEGFLQWLEKNKINIVYNFKESYISVLDEVFPNSNLKNEIEKINQNIERNKMVREKFNGSFVMKLLPLKGKALGDYLEFFKKSYNDFNNFILSSDEEIIKQSVYQHYDIWKGNT